MYRGYKDHKSEDQARTEYLIQQEMLFGDDDDKNKRRYSENKPQRERTPEEIERDEKRWKETSKFVGVFFLATAVVVLATWLLEILHFQLPVSLMKIVLSKWLFVWFVLMIVFSFSSKFKAKFLAFADKLFVRIGRALGALFEKIVDKSHK